MVRKKRPSREAIEEWLTRIGRAIEPKISVEFRTEKAPPRDSRAPQPFRGAESPGLRGPGPAPASSPSPDVPPGVKVHFSPLGTELWEYPDGRVVNKVEEAEISKAFWQDTRQLMQINAARVAAGLPPVGSLKEHEADRPRSSYGINWPP